MKKDFSFMLAVKNAFDFMVNEPKSFFVPACCVFAALFAVGFASSHLLSFDVENHGKILLFYKLGMFLVKTVLIPASALAFMTIFMQAIKDKKVQVPEQQSIINLISYGAVIYIIPSVILTGGIFTAFMALTSGKINPAVFIALSLVLVMLSLAYLAAITLYVFAPFTYLEKKGFKEGFQESVKMVKAVFVKMFLLIFLFFVCFAIISSLPHILTFALFLIEITQNVMNVISVASMILGMFMFIFLAFGAAVLTQIYIQLNDTALAE